MNRYSRSSIRPRELRKSSVVVLRTPAMVPVNRESRVLNGRLDVLQERVPVEPVYHSSKFGIEGHCVMVRSDLKFRHFCPALHVDPSK